jgi:leader peptidase (prepilin peptidase)/N-methyltransferase
MSVTDIKERAISNKALLLMFAFGLAAVFLTMDVATWIKAFLSGFGMFLLMLVMYFISMRTLGFGDVKLLALIAFVLGFTDAVQLVFTALVLTVVCGFVMFFMRKANLKTELPMVPYVLAALLVNSVAILIIK